MNNFNHWLNTVFFHNKIENWLWFLGILFIGFLLKSLFSTLFSKLIYKLIKRETQGVSVAEFIRLIKRPIEFIITLIIISLALEQINSPKSWRVIPLGKMQFSVFIDKVLETLFIFSITWLSVRIVKFIALVLAEKAALTESKRDDQMIPFVRDLVITVLVFISFFVILGFIFKQDVISLITGLGIGGVALALAARETLENLFASVTIFFDRPFNIGDSVEIGTTHQGDIEKIGFRSTRLRTPEGSLLIVPNRQMVSQNVNNHTIREFRRVKFWLKLSNDTNFEQIEELTESIKEMLALHPKTSHEVHKPYVMFENFGEYSLDILVTYYILEPEFREFKNYQSEINTEILRILRNLGLKLAIPSQNINVLK